MNASTTMQENPAIALRTEVRSLRTVITDIDTLSQEGFSQIASLAAMGLVFMETKEGYRHIENIAVALSAIKGIAEKIQECIQYEADGVGCAYVDEAAVRRAEIRGKINIEG